MLGCAEFSFGIFGGKRYTAKQAVEFNFFSPVLGKFYWKYKAHKVPNPEVLGIIPKLLLLPAR